MNKRPQTLKHVFVGIQARSNSTRFPKKIFEDMGGKSVLDQVIDCVDRSICYINKTSHRTHIQAKKYLLIHENDKLLIDYKSISGIKKIIGDENDLISRYGLLLKQNISPDFIVRITGDCPLVPSALITKCINVCVTGKYDLYTNAWPEFSTFFDGSDIEIISKKLFMWLQDQELTKDHREHVTKYFYEGNTPSWAKLGHVFGDIDFSQTKLSIDTKKDLENAGAVYKSALEKRNLWKKKYDQTNCHRF